MRIPPDSSSVWLPLTVWSAAFSLEAISLDDVLASYVEVWENGARVSQAAITLVVVPDQTTHSEGNVYHEGDGLHYVAVADSVVAAANAGRTVKVVVDSSTQTAIPVEVPIAAYVESLDPAEIRAAVGLAAANLDAQLSAKAEPGAAMGLVADAINASSLADSAANEIAAAIAGTGPHKLTVTAEDSVSGEKLSGAIVTILSAAGASLGLKKTTPTSGAVEFNVATGDYIIRTTAPSGYESAADTPVAVSVDTARTIALTVSPAYVAPAPNLCRVAVNVLNVNGTAAVGAAVGASLVALQSHVDGSLISKATTEATADASGTAYLYLIYSSQLSGNGRYRIEAELDGKPLLVAYVTVPDQPEATLTALL